MKRFYFTFLIYYFFKFFNVIAEPTIEIYAPTKEVYLFFTDLMQSYSKSPKLQDLFLRSANLLNDQKSFYEAAVIIENKTGIANPDATAKAIVTAMNFGEYGLSTVQFAELYFKILTYAVGRTFDDYEVLTEKNAVELSKEFAEYVKDVTLPTSSDYASDKDVFIEMNLKILDFHEKYLGLSSEANSLCEKYFIQAMYSKRNFFMS